MFFCEEGNINLPQCSDYIILLLNDLNLNSQANLHGASFFLATFISKSLLS